jgi:ubiquinone/menaquinone biosynthesis C-methylase UbiE
MPEYGDRDYWDKRYEHSPEPFEWYQAWAALEPILSKYIPLDASILQVGVGTSRLQLDMVEEAGYQDITSIDYSEVCIDQLAEEHSIYPQLSYLEADVRHMLFPVGCFDAVLDKGTLDAILCGEKSYDNAAAMIAEISRVLGPDGVFIEISYGTPAYRVPHLKPAEHNWDITVYTMTRPSQPTSRATSQLASANGTPRKTVPDLAVQDPESDAVSDLAAINLNGSSDLASCSDSSNKGQDHAAGKDSESQGLADKRQPEGGKQPSKPDHPWTVHPRRPGSARYGERGQPPLRVRLSAA